MIQPNDRQPNDRQPDGHLAALVTDEMVLAGAKTIPASGLIWDSLHPEYRNSCMDTARYILEAALRSLCEQSAKPAQDGPSPLTADDIGVNNFARAMSAKLAFKRTEGYHGWNDKALCSQEYLSALLRMHVDKGDPVDVANFAMMLHQRGERISPAPAGTAPDDAELLEILSQVHDEVGMHKTAAILRVGGEISGGQQGVALLVTRSFNRNK